jgi:hypothetical protein
MKRLIAVPTVSLALAGVAIVGLGACGGKSSTSPATTQASASSAGAEEWAEKTKSAFAQECESLGYSTPLCGEVLRASEVVNPKQKLKEVLTGGMGIGVAQAVERGETGGEAASRVWREYVETAVRVTKEHGIVRGE